MQPNPHVEPHVSSRQLVQPPRIDPGTVIHFHLDFGYAVATADGDVGRIQEFEVTGAGWYPLAEAERLVGHRISRAVSTPPPRPAGARWLLPPFAGLQHPRALHGGTAPAASGRDHLAAGSANGTGTAPMRSPGQYRSSRWSLCQERGHHERLPGRWRS
jgi:hypothetical protein